MHGWMGVPERLVRFFVPAQSFVPKLALIVSMEVG